MEKIIWQDEFTAIIPENTRVIKSETFFDNVDVKKIILPETIEKIESNAFWGLDDLKEITLNPTIKIIEKQAFCNCVNLTIKVNCKKEDVPAGWDKEFFGNIKNVEYLNGYICPVCGYDKLNKSPYDENGEPSHETCPCCGYEFGFDDKRGETFRIYREKWIANNFDFANKIKMPENWNVIKQLNNLSNFLFEKDIKGGGFIEFQYLEKKLPASKLFKLKNFEFWKDTSLFVEVFTYTDEKLFAPYYDEIFNCALLQNGTEGFDSFGENYYSPEKAKEIYEKIKANENLPDRQALLDWLEIAIQKNNGFYILGA